MRVRIRDARVVFREFFTIEKTRLSWQLFDGSMTEEHTRYVLRRGDSVGILCVCSGGSAETEERIVLVKQFRFPAARENHDGYLWEIPAGMVEDGEAPEKTAGRELEEETSLTDGRLTYLTSFFLSPGAVDEKMHLFRADVSENAPVIKVSGNATESENLLVRRFRMRTLLRMIREGVLMDSKTITAILLYHALRRTGRV